jgi:hypothetical protein
MTLDASGQLALGVTSAGGYRARLYGGNDNTLAIDNDGSRYTTANIANNGTTKASMYWDNTNTTLIFGPTVASSQLLFTTVGTERARIDSSGNLLVGNSVVNPASGFSTQKGFGYAAGNGKLEVATTANDYTLELGRNNATDGGIVSFRKQATVVGTISVTGSATAYNTSSDQRLKENIQDSDSASSLIDSLQVRKFDWKSDNSHQRYGFVAQELVTVAPEAVYQPTDTEEMMAVDYSKLVPMLVKEIQSLRQRLSAANL